jgi:hypothetical protein
MDLDFSRNHMNLKRSNYRAIVLVPKAKGAFNVKQFRPIAF